MSASVPTLTQKQYSRPLTHKKWVRTCKLVFAYNQERHNHIHALQSFFGRLGEREYRDALIKAHYIGLVPGRSWKMALNEAYQLVNRHWAAFGDKMYQWSQGRPWSEGQKTYLRWVCSIPECVARINYELEVKAPTPSAKWLDTQTPWAEADVLFVHFHLLENIHQSIPSP